MTGQIGCPRRHRVQQGAAPPAPRRGTPEGPGLRGSSGA
ncbi:hypothetical protein BEI_2273 [Halomonas beimenensis]|uniref:Uncharacterized protein n=1 Tax=Halomonas beimenensis TaxID=475662 RepID=A0A291P8P9_9GAMM|nr:hypothetical protein BEI_2273 [Halomonas beimenensis]